MAEKISMLIVFVDLDCPKCYHKMRKILCKLQDHERIQTISFDNKSKTITMVGPFDPQRLACKLRCKGGKVVRDVHIVDTTNMPSDGGGPPPAQPPAGQGKKGKNKNKPPPAERPPSPPPGPPQEQAPGPPPETMTMMPPPSSSPVHHHHPLPPDQGMSAVVPQPQYLEEKPPRAELEPRPMSPPPPPKEMPPPPMDMATPVPQHHHHPMPVPMKERPPPMLMPPGCPGRLPLEQHMPVAEYVIPTVKIPSWPAPPVVGPCGCPCCAPCYQGYYDSCRCHCCGSRVYGGTTVRPLPPPCGVYRTCRTFCDDDPSAACSVM